ncbi:hypothetical protein A2841_02775 [Candidatus Kaiserbacteria bacterium RIFCSPHIGHO2_01_FULL_48_10]|uniref:Uncharacterized protein n=1 Tax=Candidatus Kaiserbacteria bacterium RIFCSPHIGHO2_01_FULL_48_10 TaxID=1798476 RepID=A0A1F6C543_9BACT|nr:MAG: hypothetical protein A2841_02775 [Candidatus Kaiserbacteria bacterium RIFCSPHIGHO2_01_FULL_48_10]
MSREALQIDSEHKTNSSLARLIARIHHPSSVLSQQERENFQAFLGDMDSDDEIRAAMIVLNKEIYRRRRMQKR